MSGLMETPPVYKTSGDIGAEVSMETSPVYGQSVNVGTEGSSDGDGGGKYLERLWEECQNSNVNLNGGVGRLVIEMVKCVDEGQVLDGGELFFKEYTKDPEVKKAIDKSMDKYKGVLQQPEDMQELQMDVVIDAWKKILISIAKEDMQGDTQGVRSPGAETRPESPSPVKNKAKDRILETSLGQTTDHCTKGNQRAVITLTEIAQTMMVPANSEETNLGRVLGQAADEIEDKCKTDGEPVTGEIVAKLLRGEYLSEEDVYRPNDKQADTAHKLVKQLRTIRSPSHLKTQHFNKEDKQKMVNALLGRLWRENANRDLETVENTFIEIVALCTLVGTKLRVRDQICFYWKNMDKALSSLISQASQGIEEKGDMEGPWNEDRIFPQLDMDELTVQDVNLREMYERVRKEVKVLGDNMRQWAEHYHVSEAINLMRPKTSARSMNLQQRGSQNPNSQQRGTQSQNQRWSQNSQPKGPQNQYPRGPQHPQPRGPQKPK